VVDDGDETVEIKVRLEWTDSRLAAFMTYEIDKSSGEVTV
jgi:hypothetical protein